MIEIGAKLPRFKLPASGDAALANTDFKGSKLVLFFYPKDSTAICTIEAQDFRDLYPKFKRAKIAVVGVSRDDVASHDKFCDKQDLPYPLLADTDEKLCNAFGVIGDKNMYGRVVRGIIRSTFLFDAKGVLRHAWRGVRVKGHAADVLAKALAL